MGCTESLSKNKKSKKLYTVPPIEISVLKPNANVAATSIRSFYPARKRCNISFKQPSSAERIERQMIENPTNGTDKLLWLVNLKAKVSQRELAGAKGLQKGNTATARKSPYFLIVASRRKIQAEQLTSFEFLWASTKIDLHLTTYPIFRQSAPRGARQQN